MRFVSYVATPHGLVRVSENTAAALRKKFPRWDDASPAHAGRFHKQQNKPEELLTAAATALAALCDACDQELVEL